MVMLWWSALIINGFCLFICFVCCVAPTCAPSRAAGLAQTLLVLLSACLRHTERKTVYLPSKTPRQPTGTAFLFGNAWESRSNCDRTFNPARGKFLLTDERSFAFAFDVVIWIRFCFLSKRLKKLGVQYQYLLSGRRNVNRKFFCPCETEEGGAKPNNRSNTSQYEDEDEDEDDEEFVCINEMHKSVLQCLCLQMQVFTFLVQMLLLENLFSKSL